MNSASYSCIIGIDPGTHTGYAEWYPAQNRSGAKGRLAAVQTLQLHAAMQHVQAMHAIHGAGLLVRFEDARLRKWYGAAGREKLQGAGSIKRDSTIWGEFLTASHIAHEAVAPRAVATKLPAAAFAAITAYTARTSEHGRDAAMLVYGL